MIRVRLVLRDVVVCSQLSLFPDVGLVLSTREPAKLRDGLRHTGSVNHTDVAPFGSATNSRQPP